MPVFKFCVNLKRKIFKCSGSNNCIWILEKARTYKPNNRSIVIDVAFGVSTTPQSGTAVYADSRKTQYSGLTAVTNYIAFNGAISHKDFKDYAQTGFTISATTTGRFLTNAPSCVDTDTGDLIKGMYMRPANNNWFNFYSLSSQTQAVFLYVSNSNGDSFRIPQGSLTGSNKTMLTVGVGCKNFPSSIQVLAGSLPVVKSSTTYYSFYLATSAGTRTSETFRFNIYDNCVVYDKFELLFQDRAGSFVTGNFELKSVHSISVERGEYQKLLGDLSGTKFGYESTDKGRTQISSIETEQYVLNSGWLTVLEAAYLKELYTSPNVYMRAEGETEYWPVVVVTNERTIPKKYNKKNIQYEITVQLANRNNIQSY